MGYFNRLPNIEYDKKPLTFPYSETEYILVKNFFRKYKISESSFNFNTVFNKYALLDNERLDQVSLKFYKDTDFDWVIALTNNVMNVYHDLPKPLAVLYDMVNESYRGAAGNQSINPADRIHHYETKEVKDSVGKIVLRAGIKVESTFSNSPVIPSDGKFYYYDSGTRVTVSVAGTSVITPVTNYQHEEKLNENKREIYVLKPRFIQEFISQFESGMPYSNSSSYIDKTTKKSGI